MVPIGNKPEGLHGLFIYSFKIINSTTQFCDKHIAQYFRVSNLLLPFVIFVNFNLHRCSYMITCLYIYLYMFLIAPINLIVSYLSCCFLYYCICQISTIKVFPEKKLILENVTNMI